MATVVSIGRNIADEETVRVRPDRLSDRDWQAFITETLDVARTFGDVYFGGEGDGVYQDEPEEAFTVVFEDVDTLERAALVASLAELASRYGQESIALTTGETEFVAADGR
jgi:hypothetical protein